MSRKIGKGISRVMLAVIATFAATMVTANEAVQSNEKRVSETLHFETGGRANDRDPLKGKVSIDEFDALETGIDKSRSSRAPGATDRSNESTGFDFWIYDADIILFNDDDNDGYFYGIDLLFDADTIYGAADVYAVVYLSYEGGPWNEYAVTDDFTIFGTSSSDEYVLVTELMSGYPTGEYDLLIELFDAIDGAFVASFGPEDSSELSYLPLEDFNRDAPAGGPVVVVTRSGGGAAGIWMLLALGAIAGMGRVLNRK